MSVDCSLCALGQSAHAQKLHAFVNISVFEPQSRGEETNKLKESKRKERKKETPYLFLLLASMSEAALLAIYFCSLILKLCAHNQAFHDL